MSGWTGKKKKNSKTEPDGADAKAGSEGEVEDSSAESDLSSESSEEAADEAGELKLRLQRKVAELENYRKQTEKRMADIRRFVTRDLLHDLLPILDNFGAAMTAADQGQDAKNVLIGVHMIHDMLEKFMGDHGAQLIPAVGERFDPGIHEALSRAVSDDQEPGTILTEIQRGWRMNDLVVRHARVVVAADAEPEADPSSNTENAEESSDETHEETDED